MHEPVSGLNVDSMVRYNGVRVGRVKNIELSAVDPQQVKLILNIEEGTPVTTSTYATLVNQGITGVTTLNLTSDSSTFIPLQKTPGEPYPVIPSRPSFFNQLEQDIHDISRGFKRLLSKKNADNFKRSLENLEAITNAFAKNKDNINQALHELPLVIKELKKGILQFDVMADNMSDASKQVSSTMKASKIGVEKISRQTIPSTTLLFRRLDVIAANLEKLSAQLRQNPSVIFRGNATPQPGPGE